MKKHFILLLFITIISFSAVKSQDLNKDETLNYISNLFNKNHPSDWDQMEARLENQSLVIIYRSADGSSSRSSYKLKNFKLYTEPSIGDYCVFIIEDSGEARAVLFLPSLVDANRMIKAINHLSKFVGNDKDPFD